MSTINLADAKVSYEGQNLPAINLIGKLQTELQEVACRLAVIASTLGDLQAALLNSTTVEVKLTLSKEDFNRFRSLGGMDDNERIRKAVMALIHPAEAQPPQDIPESGPAVTPCPASAPVPPGPNISGRQGIVDEPFMPRKSSTICPICKFLVDLPENLQDQSSVEVKCPNCGAKSLLKSKR
jgi:DNA-directed RNA polymerase subunit RPC12/RpoP